MIDKPTDIVLYGVGGSTAFGLAHAGSDIDHYGIYRAPLREALGLNAGKVVSSSWTQHEPDITLHELGKFINLALKCNPTVLEQLWFSDYEIMTEIGARLVGERASFLYTKGVRGAYGGYAFGQARKLSLGVGVRAKAARHALRLLHMGEQLLTTGTMTLDCADMRQELFELGDTAERDLAVYWAEFELRYKHFINCDSVLPDYPDYTYFERFLPRARLDKL